MSLWSWVKSKFKKHVTIPKNEMPQAPTPIIKELVIKYDYKDWWDSLVPKNDSDLEWWKKKMLEGRPRYEALSEIFYLRTGHKVPWAAWGCAHALECSFNFSGVLHNGERIIGTGKKTSLVPKGRGPFNTFEEAAIDAFLIKALPKKWVLNGFAQFQESFNGYGYRHYNIKTPYLVGKSNLYTKGKYIRDHVFSADAVSSQVGVLTGLKAIGYKFDE